VLEDRVVDEGLLNDEGNVPIRQHQVGRQKCLRRAHVITDDDTRPLELVEYFKVFNDHRNAAGFECPEDPPGILAPNRQAETPFAAKFGTTKHGGSDPRIKTEAGIQSGQSAHTRAGRGVRGLQFRKQFSTRGHCSEGCALRR